MSNITFLNRHIDALARRRSVASRVLTGHTASPELLRAAEADLAECDLLWSAPGEPVFIPIRSARANQALAAIRGHEATHAARRKAWERPSAAVSGYRDLGDFSVAIGRGTPLSCHHCKVSWTGCMAESECPECGRPKGFRQDDHNECYCDTCKPELFAAQMVDYARITPVAALTRAEAETTLPPVRQFRCEEAGSPAWLRKQRLDWLAGVVLLLAVGWLGGVISAVMVL